MSFSVEVYWEIAEENEIFEKSSTAKDKGDSARWYFAIADHMWAFSQLNNSNDWEIGQDSKQVHISRRYLVPSFSVSLFKKAHDKMNE